MAKKLRKFNLSFDELYVIVTSYLYSSLTEKEIPDKLTSTHIKHFLQNRYPDADISLATVNSKLEELVKVMGDYEYIVYNDIPYGLSLLKENGKHSVYLEELEFED